MDQISNSLKLSKNTLHSKKGMVTSQNKLASHVGVDILNRGGNAVDAAIATSFALGAAEPWMSGIGGGGYMMVLKKVSITRRSLTLVCDLPLISTSPTTRSRLKKAGIFSIYHGLRTTTISRAQRQYYTRLCRRYGVGT